MTAAPSPMIASSAARTAHATPVARPRRTPPWVTWPVLASVAFSIVFIARSAASTRDGIVFTLFDDAMISMRYARNLAHGHGLVWNAGQAPVEGYTNFLWTVVMAATHVLPLPDRLAALPVMVLGAALLAIEVVLCGALARRLTGPQSRVPVAVCWIVALYYPLAAWTLRGMEVGAEAVVVTGAAILALRLRDEPDTRTAWWLGLVLTAGVLTRDDIAVPAVIVLAFVAITVRRDARRACITAAAAPVVAAVAAHTILRALYYDALLPNTYYLKVSGVPLSIRLHRGAVALAEVTALHLGVLAVLAVAYFVLARRRAPVGCWLLAACVVGAAAYVLAVGADAWEWTLYSDRYLAPVVPFLVILAVMGGEALVRRARSRRSRDRVAVGVLVALGGLLIVVALDALPDTRIIQVPAPGAGTALHRALWLAPIVLVVAFVALAPRARPWWGTALVVAMVVAVSGPSVSAWWHRNAAAQPDDVEWARYGAALRRATRPGVTIAMSSAGNIAYFDRRPGVDLLGKSDRVIAHERPVYVEGYFLPGHSKRDLAYSVGKLRPGVVAQIFGATPADLASLRSWGYVPMGPAVWYLPGTPGIDVPALRRAVRLYH